MVSFLDKRRLSGEEIVGKYIPRLLNDYQVEGLVEIAQEIQNMPQEGKYAELVQTAVKYEKYGDTEAQKFKCPFAEKAKKILGNQPINLPPITRVTSYHDLAALYNLITRLYVTQNNRPLNIEEIQNICNNLEKKIMTTLNQFDQFGQKNTTTTKINTTYLQKLRKTKWKNKKTRYLWLNLAELVKYSGYPALQTPIRFDIEQTLLTQFLSACSAVNNNREKINMDDVITAYKTYFKLLKTDLPSLIEEQGVEE